jgi:DNA polymerase III delta subunit
MGPGAVGALLEATGADLGRILGELGKLRSAVGAGGTIGPEEISLHVAGYAHRSLYDLVAAVSARDLAGSLRILGKLTVRTEEALFFIGLLGKRLRMLWFFAGRERPLPPIFKTWPAKPEELRLHGKRFTRAEIERGLEALLAADGLLKGSGLPPQLVLEQYLIRLLGVPSRKAS